jgi:hypothetical protein
MMAAASRPGGTFFGSVAAGGEAGVKSLDDARAAKVAAEEKRFALQQQLNQAERAENIAIGKFGVDSAQADQARADTKEAAKLKHENEAAIHKATNDAHIRGAELAKEGQIGAAGVRASVVGAGKDADTKKLKKLTALDASYDKAIKVISKKNSFKQTAEDKAAIIQLTNLQTKNRLRMEALGRGEDIGDVETSAPDTTPKGGLKKTGPSSFDYTPKT